MTAASADGEGLVAGSGKRRPPVGHGRRAMGTRSLRAPDPQRKGRDGNSAAPGRFRSRGRPLRRFDVVREDVVVGPLRLHDRAAPLGRGPHRRGRLRPRRAPALLGRAVAERATCWPAHLAARDLRGRRVVELGCGVGLPSRRGRPRRRATSSRPTGTPTRSPSPAPTPPPPAPASRRCWSTGPTRPPTSSPARGRPRGRRGRPLRGAQRPPPSRALVPRILAPRGEVVDRRPAPPPRRGPARAARRARAGRSPTEEVRHGGARRRERARSSGSTA